MAIATLVSPSAIVASSSSSSRAASDLPIGPHAWRVLTRDSGPVDYYTVVEDPVLPHIHADYKPGWQTTVLAVEVPDSERRAFHHLTWNWRAMVLPRGGNECASGHEDSAAVVYVTSKRGLKHYTLKYVWSSVAGKGSVCDRKRNPFVAQDTIVLESGPPTGAWKTETIDLDADFRAHFGAEDMPDLHGLGIMSDGDQTQSESAADYAGFVLSP